MDSFQQQFELYEKGMIRTLEILMGMVNLLFEATNPEVIKAWGRLPGIAAARCCTRVVCPVVT